MIFKNDFYFFSHLIKRLKTSRREKSVRNTSVSNTREFWDLRLKTKSWNFVEVRWRPYSPKGSFSEDFILNLKRDLGLFLCYVSLVPCS